MTWQMLRDLCLQLTWFKSQSVEFGTLLVLLSRSVLISCGIVACSVSAASLASVSTPIIWNPGRVTACFHNQTKPPTKSQVAEEPSYIHESRGRLNKLIKNMARSSLCSRRMSRSLMSSFTSGDIAGGTNTPKRWDKTGVTAASPLLFKRALKRENEGKRPAVKASTDRANGRLL